MARQRDPLRNFKFTVSISGFGSRVGFQSIDGLSRTTEVIEYREGGDRETMRKIPGQTTFENLVLERGKYPERSQGGDEFLDWANEIYNPATVPLNPPNDDPNRRSGFRREITITLQDKAGLAIRQWVAEDCWPCGFEHETLDAAGNEILIERLEVCHEGLTEVGLA